MRVVQEMIGPERAIQFLKMNNVNRRYRPYWAKQIKGWMDRGEWKLTHQGIAIGADMALKDGQHRLNAVIMHGKPVPMMVCYDTPADTFGALDQGLKRTVEDHLPGGKVLLQPATFLAKLVFSTRTSIQQIAQVHAVLLPHAERLASIKTWPQKGVTTAPIRAAAVLQMARGHDADYICNMYKMLAEHDTSNPAMPKIAHSYLAQIALGRKGASPPPHDLFVRGLSLFDKSKVTLGRMLVRQTDTHIAEARQDVLRMLAQK